MPSEASASADYSKTDQTDTKDMLMRPMKIPASQLVDSKWPLAGAKRASDPSGGMKIGLAKLQPPPPPPMKTPPPRSPQSRILAGTGAAAETPPSFPGGATWRADSETKPVQ